MKDFKQNPAANSGVQARLICFVCKKEIVDNGWFCRVPQKTEGAAGSQAQEILLCSPVCALRYFGDSQPSGDSLEPNYDGYERTLPVAPGPKPSKARNGSEKQ
jgi:hypothetical protein